MQQDTASTLVAAGAVTVFLMPLLGSLTYRVADAHPVEMAKDIAHTPADWRLIFDDHRRLRRLVRQGVDDETIARLLKIAAQRKGLSTPEEERAYAEKIVQRVRAERQKRLRELGSILTRWTSCRVNISIQAINHDQRVCRSHALFMWAQISEK